MWRNFRIIFLLRYITSIRRAHEQRFSLARIPSPSDPCNGGWAYLVVIRQWVLGQGHRVLLGVDHRVPLDDTGPKVVPVVVIHLLEHNAEPPVPLAIVLKLPGALVWHHGPVPGVACGSSVKRPSTRATAPCASLVQVAIDDHPAHDRDAELSAHERHLDVLLVRDRAGRRGYRYLVSGELGKRTVAAVQLALDFSSGGTGMAMWTSSSVCRQR